MDPGTIMGPLYYKMEDGKEAYRLIKLIEKKDAHFANVSQDYNLIKMYAENDKRQNKLSDWINLKIEETYIYINEDFINQNFVYNWKN